MCPVTTTASPATMDDVAALAGVSTSTVSRALRDSPLISASTRERVRQAASQLDFALSRAASALATGRLGRIGLLVSGPLSTWFNASVLDAAYAELRASGQELVIYSTKTETDRAHMLSCAPGGERHDAYVASRGRAGITREAAWLQSTPLGDLAGVLIESDNIESALRALATSDDPFDVQFRDEIQDVHGIDLAAGFPPPEQVLDFRG
jgi:transcriptional regulator with XRE-family HTH domain